MAHPPDASVIDIHDEGELGEKLGASKGEPGHGGASGSVIRHGSRGHYDPDPPRHVNILDQLVAALCDVGLEGKPQDARK